MSYNTSPSLCDLLHAVWHSLDSSMLLQMALFHPFPDWVIFRRMYVSRLPHPCLYWWTFRWLLHLGCCNRSAMSIGVRVPFPVVFFPSYMPSSGISVSHVHASVTQTLCDLVTVACQAPLFMGWSRHEYWSGLPIFPPGNLLNAGIKLTFSVSPALQVNPLPRSHWGSPQ